MEERQVSVDGHAAAPARPVRRLRDPEPDRVRGHVPAARGPARPVPAQADPAPARPARKRCRCSPGTPPGSTRATLPRRASARWPGLLSSPPVEPRSGGCRHLGGARATRSTSAERPASRPALSLGVSPRGATALLASARAWAWLSGRDFVTPDDIKALARPDPASPGPAARRGRARGGHRGRCPRRRARLRPGPSLTHGPHGTPGAPRSGRCPGGGRPGRRGRLVGARRPARRRRVAGRSRPAGPGARRVRARAAAHPGRRHQGPARRGGHRRPARRQPRPAPRAGSPARRLAPLSRRAGTTPHRRRAARGAHAG